MRYLILTILILGCAQSVTPTTTTITTMEVQGEIDYVPYFIDIINTVAVERVGQPIEGFDPFIYSKAYPGLVSSDFDGVKSLQGVYSFRDDQLFLVEESNVLVHSAAGTISQDGMRTLLETLEERLGIPVNSEESIQMIISSISYQICEDGAIRDVGPCSCTEVKSRGNSTESYTLAEIEGWESTYGRGYDTLFCCSGQVKIGLPSDKCQDL